MLLLKFLSIGVFSKVIDIELVFGSQFSTKNNPIDILDNQYLTMFNNLGRSI